MIGDPNKTLKQALGTAVKAVVPITLPTGKSKVELYPGDWGVLVAFGRSTTEYPPHMTLSEVVDFESALQS